MGSERLPGKILLDLTNGKKTIDFLFEQLKSSKLKKKIVAIPENNEDDILFEHLKNSKIPCFRGSSLDVLDRFYRCAKEFSFKHIMRITGDNPLIDPDVVDKAIKEYNNYNCDYFTNSIHRTFPNGTEVEIFSFNSLEVAWKFAKKNLRENMSHHIFIIILKNLKFITLYKKKINQTLDTQLTERKIILWYQRLYRELRKGLFIQLI